MLIPSLFASMRYIEAMFTLVVLYVLILLVLLPDVSCTNVRRDFLKTPLRCILSEQSVYFRDRQRLLWDKFWRRQLFTLDFDEFYIKKDEVCWPKLFQCSRVLFGWLNTRLFYCKKLELLLKIPKIATYKQNLQLKNPMASAKQFLCKKKIDPSESQKLFATGLTQCSKTMYKISF